MLSTSADVFAHLATRYTLSGGGPNWVELWWKLTIDGERVVQHQLVYVDDTAGRIDVSIVSDVHCRFPLRVRWTEIPIEVGSLAFDGDWPVVRQPVIAGSIDAVHLDRVMEAVATEAARLARLARLAVA